MQKQFCAVFVVAMLAAASLFGQTIDGNIVGTVIDPSGAAVPHASVELMNSGTAVKATTTSDADGHYRFGNVLVGRYSITVSAPGFTTLSMKDVAVELNKTTTAVIRLEVGALSASITVAESNATIDATTAQISNNFNARMAADLPVSAHSAGGVQNLSLLGAGVASSGGVGVGIGPSIGGQRPRNNNFTVEGVDNNNKMATGPTAYIPNEGVQEFTVLQNQFSAEFGHSSGGQFNTIVRGGTNEVHGRVYEYLQSRKLNALDQSFKRQGTLKAPRYDQNRMGGAISGPIQRNKLFYYGLYEYNPLGQASATGSIFAPTAEGYATLSAIPGVSATNLEVLKKYLPAAPLASRPTMVNGQAIPIGIVPILQPNYANQYNWLVSMDYNLSERDQLRGRYVDNKTAGLTTLANLPAFFHPKTVTSHLVTLSELHSFRSNLSNELRLAFNRYNDNSPIPDVRYPGLDTFPNIQINEDLAVQIGPAVNGPQAYVQNTYQIVENLSWVKGRHDLKFGFDGRDMIGANTFVQSIRGDYQYSNLDRFLLDKTPNVAARRNIGSKPYSANQIALYGFVNDNWKATRNLTLNLGLRYEFTSVAKSMREFALNSVADVPGVLTFFEPKPQKKNFAPRVGFAYSPGNNGTTSIRGGFGIAYDQIFDNVGLNARPPQITSTYVVPVSEATGFLQNGGIKPDAPTGTLTASQARAATSSWLGDQKLGYSINWNLGIQHTFAKDYTAEVRYVGTRGLHLIFQQQLNRAAIVTPTHSLPTFLTAPSQATLDALPLTLAQLTTERNTIGNTMAQYGFALPITAYVPRGNSEYHGLAAELTKRFSANSLFKAAYTWSHAMDDSTAEMSSTVLTPRRPQDFDNIRSEWSSSSLDRRHRISFTWLYETPWFQRDSNWLKKNVLGNYQIAGTYIAESPAYITVQSVLDANQNGDAAADRSIRNPSGTKGLSSDVTPLRNSAGATVGYLAMNPNAEYIRAREGAFATGGRNTMATRGINNWDLTVMKNFSFSESMKLQLRGDFFNSFNHPQYTPGRLSNVLATPRPAGTNFLTPGNALFGQFDQVWSSNPRIIQLGARFTF